MTSVVYTYANCSTCRKAVQWLRAHNFTFIEKPIRETPPTPEELKRMLVFQGGAIRRLFNTSGQEYRALRLSEKLPTLSEQEALRLLASNGHLVKRPFLLGTEIGLVGFDPEVWSGAFSR